MTQVEVLVDGVPKVGTLTNREMGVDPLTQGHSQRLTVRWEDGTLSYIWPEREVVREVTAAPGPPTVPGVPDGALAHLQPPPGQQPLPPPPLPPEPSVAPAAGDPGGAGPGTPGWRPPIAGGVSIAGQPIVGPQVITGQSYVPPSATAPIVVATSYGPPPRVRFMVQPKTGKPTRFHTHPDCAQVTNGAKQLVVDDEQIEFFGLKHCAACKRKDEQLTWQELVSDFFLDLELVDTMTLAYRLQEVLEGRGFRVTPPAVDRPVRTN